MSKLRHSCISIEGIHFAFHCFLRSTALVVIGLYYKIVKMLNDVLESSLDSVDILG